MRRARGAARICIFADGERVGLRLGGKPEIAGSKEYLEVPPGPLIIFYTVKVTNCFTPIFRFYKNIYFLNIIIYSLNEA